MPEQRIKEDVQQLGDGFACIGSCAEVMLRPFGNKENHLRPVTEAKNTEMARPPHNSGLVCRTRQVFRQVR